MFSIPPVNRLWLDGKHPLMMPSTQEPVEDNSAGETTRETNPG